MKTSNFLMILCFLVFNGDSIISPAETESVTFLNLAGDSITDLKGTEIFGDLAKF